MSAKYPILLDLSERLAVIIGGGKVAARKASSLITASGSRGLVRVVAPEFDRTMPNEVERVTERYRHEHLQGAALVFAATDSSDVNAQVVRDAKSRGIFVSRADEPDDGDFIVPAVHRDGAITIGVAAGSPALSAFIRDQIAAKIDDAWRALADEMHLLRPLVVDSGLPAEQRADVLRSLASQDAIDVLATSGSDGLRAWLVAKFPKLQSTILHAGSR
ncbi:MAG: bifunctional precorrin-2 dehydrogenase/sirohydrochlorin ferrochelatase [Anaerolineae bacterium]|nr:bifunctional precorrin-2 dehydrogenase/sirohydrochlorin ferrochelatase [Phycisphaerae bacterium]